MVNFVDEYPRQLDERGRIILPAKVRENMSETVYVTRSMSDKWNGFNTIINIKNLATSVHLP